MGTVDLSALSVELKEVMREGVDFEPKGNHIVMTPALKNMIVAVVRNDGSEPVEQPWIEVARKQEKTDGYDNRFTVVGGSLRSGEEREIPLMNVYGFRPLDLKKLAVRQVAVFVNGEVLRDIRNPEIPGTGLLSRIASGNTPQMIVNTCSDSRTSVVPSGYGERKGFGPRFLGPGEKPTNNGFMSAALGSCARFFGSGVRATHVGQKYEVMHHRKG